MDSVVKGRNGAGAPGVQMKLKTATARQVVSVRTAKRNLRVFMASPRPVVEMTNGIGRTRTPYWSIVRRPSRQEVMILCHQRLERLQGDVAAMTPAQLDAHADGCKCNNL